MNFKKYLILTEGKPQGIEESTAKQLIEQNCQHVVNNKIQIYRGMRGISHYMTGDPKEGNPRISANTSNYYTLLIDNSPLWNGYPKRSRSFICSTSANTSSGYGTVYRVYPYDNGLIGVCNKSDFWYSFPVIINQSLRVRDMSYFNMVLQILFTQVYTYFQLPTKNKYDDNIQDIKAACAVVDKFFTAFDNVDEIIAYFEKKGMKSVDQMKHLLTLIESTGKSTYEALNILLSPVNNNIDGGRITDFPSLPEFVEVWTDATCVFEVLSGEI